VVGPGEEDALARAAVQVVENESPVIRERIRGFGGIRALDAAALVAVNHLPHTPASDRYVSLLSDLGRGIGWAGICLALAWRGGHSGRRVAARTIVAMLLANYIAQGPLKRVFGRRRPFHSVTDHIVVGVRTVDTSFPSGHTAASFAVATSFAAAYPAYSILAFALATGVGLSRVYLGHHYPSDVVGGAAVGGLVGGLASLIPKRDPCRSGG
jgi:undecaprenyl-diphosphatase